MEINGKGIEKLFMNNMMLNFLFKKKKVMKKNSSMHLYLGID
jgi:hypothetical protein